MSEYDSIEDIVGSYDQVVVIAVSCCAECPFMETTASGKVCGATQNDPSVSIIGEWKMPVAGPWDRDVLPLCPLKDWAHFVAYKPKG